MFCAYLTTWGVAFRAKFTDFASLPDYRGIYRFAVLVTGHGVEPAGWKIDVTYNGGWYNGGSNRP
jgi:hypothetical protein